MTLAMLWNRSIFQNDKTYSLLKSHSGEVKIELSAVRRGRRPGLNSCSGCEPSSPHTTIFGAILIEISTNCSQYSLLWALCQWLPVGLNNSTFKKKTGTNHTAILTVYSMVPWGFWETIFFSFFSLLLFWLSSKKKKKLFKKLTFKMFTYHLVLKEIYRMCKLQLWTGTREHIKNIC